MSARDRVNLIRECGLFPIASKFAAEHFVTVEEMAGACRMPSMTKARARFCGHLVRELGMTYREAARFVEASDSGVRKAIKRWAT